jgi:hypothetical protein
VPRYWSCGYLRLLFYLVGESCRPLAAAFVAAPAPPPRTRFGSPPRSPSSITRRTAQGQCYRLLTRHTCVAAGCLPLFGDAFSVAGVAGSGSSWASSDSSPSSRSSSSTTYVSNHRWWSVLNGLCLWHLCCSRLSLFPLGFLLWLNRGLRLGWLHRNLCECARGPLILQGRSLIYQKIQPIVRALGNLERACDLNFC